MTLITNLNKEVEAAGGLFMLVAKLQKEKRYAHRIVQTRWVTPLTRNAKGKGKIYLDTSSGPVAQPPEKPKPAKALVITSADTVDERDEQLEELLLPDMPTELSLLPKPIEAGVDEPEDGAQDSDANEGTGQSDGVVNDNGD
jgi:hypothetical protein